MTTTLKLAAALLGVYAALVLLNAGLHTSGSGDQSGLPQTLLRSAGFLAVAWSVWNGQPWAWWIAVVLSGLFAAIGVAGLVTHTAASTYVGSRVPPSDAVTLVLMTAALGVAFVCLLLPGSREALE